MAKNKSNEKAIEDPNEVKRRLVLDIWTRHYETAPVDLFDLPLDVVVTVMAMMALGSVNDSKSIGAVKGYLYGLFPIADEFHYFLNRAYDHRAIIVDVHRCRLEDFDDDGQSFYMQRVNYAPNISWGLDIPIEFIRDPSKASPHIHELFLKGLWNEDWSDELLDLWNRIAVAECLQYAENRAENYGFQAGAVKLDEQCRTLLQKFSVSQVHSMISTAFHNAAAFQKTADCTSYRHALNTIPGKITTLASKASQVKEWDRINQLPQTEFSLTLFNKLLGKEGDIGFYKCPAATYAAIAKERLDSFKDPRGLLHTEKISMSELANGIADSMSVLHYMAQQGLNDETSMIIRAKVQACLDLWTIVSEIPVSNAPALIGMLAALHSSFEEQGFDFEPMALYYLKNYKKFDFT